MIRKFVLTLFCIFTLYITPAFSSTLFSDPSEHLIYWNGIAYVKLDMNALKAFGVTYNFDPIEGLTISYSHGKSIDVMPPRQQLVPLHLYPLPMAVTIGNYQLPSSTPALYGAGHLYVPFNSTLLLSELNLKLTVDGLRSENTSELPHRFNTYSILPSEHFIRNQGSANTCWAIATNAMLELYIAKKFNHFVSFSIDDLIERAPIPVTSYSGGNFQTAMSYYLNHLGPISSETGQNYKVTGYRHLNSIAEMKLHIHNFGSAVSSIHYNSVDPIFYNPETFAYKNPTHLNPMTHDVLIVGWDDYFPKEYFLHEPQNNGAFIAQNSFGNEWGKEGLFYISYEDPHIVFNTHGITSVDFLYDSEFLYFHNDKSVTHFDGFPGQFNAQGRVHFKANRREEIYALGIFSNKHGKEVDLFINEKNVLSYSLPYSGFHFLVLDSPVSLKQGEKFSVTAVYKGDSSFLIPLQAPYPGIHYEVIARQGQSEIGTVGEDALLIDTTRFRENATVAIRVYTK